jgi:hypothetical protein
MEAGVPEEKEEPPHEEETVVLSATNTAATAIGAGSALVAAEQANLGRPATRTAPTSLPINEDGPSNTTTTTRRHRKTAPSSVRAAIAAKANIGAAAAAATTTVADSPPVSPAASGSNSSDTRNKNNAVRTAREAIAAKANTGAAPAGAANHGQVGFARAVASRDEDDEEEDDEFTTVTTASDQPGAIRMGGSDGRSVRLHKGQVNEESEEEEDLSIMVPNNSGSNSSDVVLVRSDLQPEEQLSHVQGIAVQEPRLEDLAATVAALVQQKPPPTEQQQLVEVQHDVEAIEVHESRLEALAATVSELVHRQEQLEQQQPVLIEAVMVQSTDENTRGGLGNNEERNNSNRVCGLPQRWIKWLLLSNAMMILGLLLLFFLVDSPTASPGAFIFPTGGVPVSVILNLLVEYIPDINETSSRPDSAEYRAVEWLARDNGNFFTKYDNETRLVREIGSLVQRYAMAAFYYENGFDTNSTDWLSAGPTCSWYGLECDDNGGTSISSLSLSGKQ